MYWPARSNLLASCSQALFTLEGSGLPEFMPFWTAFSPEANDALSYQLTCMNLLSADFADCCATFSPERHIEACKAVAGYCRQRTLTTLLQEFMTVMAKSGAAYLPPGGPGDGHGGQPGSGGLDNGGHGGGKLPGGAGSGAYGVGSAGAGGLGGGTGLDSEAGVGGGGTAAGYKRDYEAMIEQERDGRHSGDNFSPGLGGPDQSGGMCCV